MNSNYDNSQITTIERDPESLIYGTEPSPNFAAEIVCDETWKPMYRRACDHERSMKEAGGIGGVGLVLLACAATLPVPAWVNGVLFWFAIPMLILAWSLYSFRDDSDKDEEYRNGI